MGEDFKLTSRLTLGREYKCYFRTKLCNVEGCKTESMPNVIVSYYSLPSNPNMAQKWLEALNLMEAPYNFIVCSSHFTENDFSATLKSEHMTYRVMKSNAVPNRNLPASMAVEYHVPIVEQNNEITVKNEIIDADSNVNLLNKARVNKIKPIYIKMKDDTNGLPDIANSEIEEQEFIIQYDDTQEAVSSIIENQLVQEDNDINKIKQEFVREVTSKIKSNSETKNKNGNKAKKLKKEEDLVDFKVKVLTIVEQVAEIQSRASSSDYINATYKCVLCYKGYMTEDTYNSHMAKHGEESGNFDCIVCHRRFKSVHNLKRHMTKHAHRYTCQKCELSTCKREEAEAHCCEVVVRYACDLCTSEFQSISSLMLHVREFHPSIHVCEVCGFSFIGLKGLNHHTRLKHPEQIQ